ncbi:pseudouridine synthase [Tunicatimonas pelagia]|uniref:pseudouridine synthase n=1 Tax=Tunicatimonas pelagia TaxID=931531 RepID=UPI002665ABD9|nr:pseudouridine synthase [Tunicatimonas pelagia]WKN45578.1 pseudouridine synthase [Tunicatimonas pelagia]
MLLPLLLPIIYQDLDLVAINKPHGLLVHRSRIARDAQEFALQLLRDQLGQTVYPVHRIDRKTGGVLLFALSPEVLSALQTQFRENTIDKQYLAIVRGYADELGGIDYALENDRGKVQEAFTQYKTLAQTELNVPFGKHATSRYSLVLVKPQTGRYHQIRKHFKHIFHPIIGDRPHGCNKQNRLFKERWQMNTMLLHAASLTFIHPISSEQILIKAPLQSEFQRMIHLMGWSGLEEIRAFLPS